MRVVRSFFCYVVNWPRSTVFRVLSRMHHRGLPPIWPRVRRFAGIHVSNRGQMGAKLVHTSENWSGKDISNRYNMSNHPFKTITSVLKVDDGALSFNSYHHVLVLPHETGRCGVRTKMSELYHLITPHRHWFCQKPIPDFWVKLGHLRAVETNCTRRTRKSGA